MSGTTVLAPLPACDMGPNSKYCS